MRERANEIGPDDTLEMCQAQSRTSGADQSFCREMAKSTRRTRKALLSRIYDRNHHLAIFLVIVQTALLSLLLAGGIALIGPVQANSTSGNSLDSLTGSNVQERTITNHHHHHHSSRQQQVSQKSPLNGRQFGDTVNDIQIECNSNSIVVTLQTNQGFNGMIYPKGLSKNSTCMTEYHELGSNITYYLPLKSCNTMSTQVEDGVEYFNTVMVQPHRRLVTNQGRGYHIRCRYQTKERVITNQEQQLNVNMSQATPSVMGSASMPSCTMRIYASNDLSREVSAENVRIGDELQLIISLDEQDVYGMLVTSCLVRDGMNWGEQPLIDEHGCPVDEEIMPEFSYARNLTRASVTFQAHKFPYTSSVYYQCNVKLCFRDQNGCAHVPPSCRNRPTNSNNRLGNDHHHQAFNYKSNSLESTSSGAGNEPADAPVAHKQRSSARTRRWIDAGELDGFGPAGELIEARPSGDQLTIQVVSGLRVDESQLEADAPEALSPSAAALTRDINDDGDPLLAAAASNAETSSSDAAAESEEQQTPAAERANKQQREREFCLSLRKFAIIISLISLLLMTAIIIMIACLIQRRNKRKLEAQRNAAYEHHSNSAYCRD